jgi:hypothetical protein
MDQFAEKMDYDNGYQFYFQDAFQDTEVIHRHARTIIFAHLYGVDEVFPLTGEPIKTVHVVDGVEYIEERLGDYHGTLGKYTTRRSFPSFSCYLYENGYRVGVFTEEGIFGMDGGPIDVYSGLFGKHLTFIAGVSGVFKIQKIEM